MQQQGWLGRLPASACSLTSFVPFIFITGGATLPLTATRPVRPPRCSASTGAAGFTSTTYFSLAGSSTPSGGGADSRLIVAGRGHWLQRGMRSCYSFSLTALSFLRPAPCAGSGCVYVWDCALYGGMLRKTIRRANQMIKVSRLWRIKAMRQSCKSKFLQCGENIRRNSVLSVLIGEKNFRRNSPKSPSFAEKIFQSFTF